MAINEPLPHIPFNTFDPHAPSGPPEPTPAPAWSRALPAFDADKIASSRAKWVESGLDPAVFDAATKDDGFEPAPDAKEIQLARASGLHPDKPTDIRPELIEAHQIHIGELTSWAASLKFQPGLGSAVIERIAS